MHLARTFAAVWLIAAGAAQAHGPTRQKLELSIDIAAPPAKVWAAIGNFHDLSWVPAVASVTGLGGNDPDHAKRDVVLKKGAGWKDEELSDYDDKAHTMGTFLPHIDPKVLPVNDWSAHLSVTDAGGGKSHVEWRHAFYRGYMNNDPPADLNEEAARKAVTGYCQPALDALKAKLEGGH